MSSGHEPEHHQVLQGHGAQIAGAASADDLPREHVVGMVEKDDERRQRHGEARPRREAQTAN